MARISLGALLVLSFVSVQEHVLRERLDDSQSLIHGQKGQERGPLPHHVGGCTTRAMRASSSAWLEQAQPAALGALFAAGSAVVSISPLAVQVDRSTQLRPILRI